MYVIYHQTKVSVLVSFDICTAFDTTDIIFDDRDWNIYLELKELL